MWYLNFVAFYELGLLIVSFKLHYKSI